MAKQLHILNGQTTLHLFREAQIEGDTYVWDEILSDGPAIYEVGTEAFWKMRKNFVVATFGQGTTGYDKLVTGFEIVKAFDAFEEIILWYEYDLFCQVNLMALLSWFYNNDVLKKTKISLICVGEVEGYNRLVGLGQLPIRMYPELLTSRGSLSESNLQYADTVWRSYTEEDPSELMFACVPHPIFQYLGKAIQSHLERFPDDTGFNVIEKEILSIISQGEMRNVDSLVRYMLQWQQYYGFGDLQYYHYIKSMKSFIEFDETLRLNDLGVKSFKSHIQRTEFPSLDLPFGGSSASLYCRNGDGFWKILK